MAIQVVANTVWKVLENIRPHQNPFYNQKFSIKMVPVQVAILAVENIANPIPVPVLLLQRMDPVRVAIRAVGIIASPIPMPVSRSQKVVHVQVDTLAVVSTV